VCQRLADREDAPPLVTVHASRGDCQVTGGEGVVLAVVDEGVDVGEHPEFAGRVLQMHREESLSVDWSRVRRPHGVKVAGLALAGGSHVTGIAPRALLLPVEVPALSRMIGHPSEAAGLRWAADHGADVICCAWSPPNPDGESGALPQHSREAIDDCLAFGRDGKGCVIVFSAGNDGSDLAFNGYASHPGIIAVGACNCHGRHPAYSASGDALWCVYPSNDPRDPVGAWQTYTTTVPAGSLDQGEAYYTTRFGFTSAATAAVAGICALIVSANPDLTYQQVKDVLRDSCEKIDLASGTYDECGHSPFYGFGRPDVARAVELAQERRLTARA